MVTHDVVDVVTLADHALVIDTGRAVDRGPVREVLSSPVNSFVARLAGLNLVAGVWDGTGVAFDGVHVAGVIAEPIADGGHATAVFAPDAVAVFTSPPTDASFRNVFGCRISQIVPNGDRMLVRADVAGNVMSAEVTGAALADLGLVVGRDVYLAVKATAVRVY
ncbi:TOBE domain-containing protein [Gordonia sp. NPDC003424]